MDFVIRDRLKRLRRRRAPRPQTPPTTDRFARLVVQALAELPEPFAAKLANLAVDIEWEPDRKTRARMGLTDGRTLFGLYEGVPLPERSVEYPPLYPDRIVIYEGPIMAYCVSDDEIKAQVQMTVRHELGHYFGLSDDEMVY